MSAFWPWVVQARQERSKSEATSELKAAQEAAAKISEEQECLKQESSQAEGTLLANKTKIFDAAKNVFCMSLRAHYAELQQFAGEKIPDALKVWESRLARRVEESIRARSLEELVFAVLPPSEQAEFCAGPWSTPNEPLLPMVAYVDLNLGLPSSEHVWRELKRASGLLLAFATGGATTMAAMMQAESVLLKSMPDDVCHLRCFLQSSQVGGSEGVVGWANLMYFPPVGDALLGRAFCSDAMMRGCLMKLPVFLAVNKLKPKTGHDVCPEQRSKDFHTALLRGFNILTPFICSGVAVLDFFLVEPESCTATLASAIAEVALARARNKDSDKPRLHLVTSVRQIATEARSSTSFRQELVAKVRECLRPLLDVHTSRQLKRAKSNSEEELLHLVDSVPMPPDLPEVLRDDLADACPLTAKQQHSALIMTAVGAEMYDAGKAKPLEVLFCAKPSFDVEAPEPLALLRMSTRCSLVVAPSLHIPERVGLYPARKFLKGEPICMGTSVEGGWTCVDMGQHRQAGCTLWLQLRHPFFQTKDTEVQLVGDPMRHVWANMISSEGLHLEPNVIAVFGKDEAGACVMDDNFLTFQAAQDIQPFEAELVWQYTIVEEKKDVEPTESEAQKAVFLFTCSQTSFARLSVVLVVCNGPDIFSRSA